MMVVTLSEHFTWDEYECKCKRKTCDAPKFPLSIFVSMLEGVRSEYGFPIPISSWARCLWYNHQPHIGGSTRSQHLLGNAVDIPMRDSTKRRKLVKALLNHGFSVIIYSSWIHADLRPGEPILLRGTK